MKKKIYTFISIIFVALLLLYFVWALAANIQKEGLERHLSDKLSLKLSDEKIAIDGFPFKFAFKLANFQSPIKNTPLTLQFLKLELVRLIYNFSDFILFAEKPLITHMDYPNFKSLSNRLKISISDKPLSGRFKLITEQENWQISDDRNFKIVEAKKVIFAIKDADNSKLDFYFRLYNLGFSFLDEILKKNPEKPNELILKGAISNSFISKQETSDQTIKLESITLEQLDINIGLFRLSCDNEVTIKLLELTSVGDVSCLLRVSFNDISRIKTEDESIQSIIDLINLILFIKNPTKTDERQKIPVKLYLNKGSIYVNAIPIYQFPIKN